MRLSHSLCADALAMTPGLSLLNIAGPYRGSPIQKLAPPILTPSPVQSLPSNLHN
jgi:hypothetical protein